MTKTKINELTPNDVEGTIEVAKALSARDELTPERLRTMLKMSTGEEQETVRLKLTAMVESGALNVTEKVEVEDPFA